MIVFKRERVFGGWRGVILGALLLTLFLVGWKVAIGQRNITDVHCLFVIETFSKLPFLVCSQMASAGPAFLSLIIITGVSLYCAADEIMIPAGDKTFTTAELRAFLRLFLGH